MESEDGNSSWKLICPTGMEKSRAAPSQRVLISDLMFAAFSVCCIVCTAKPKRKMCNGSSVILCLPASVLNWDKAQWIKALRYSRESSQHKWRGEEKERFNCAVRPLCYSVSSAGEKRVMVYLANATSLPDRESVRQMQLSAECHFLITALREQRWSAGCVCWSCCAAVSVHIWFASIFHLKVNPMHKKITLIV